MLDSTQEDVEAQELMAKWDAEHGVKDNDETVPDGDDEPLDLDDVMEKFRRDVVVTDKAIDCVMLGVCDIQQAMVDFESLTGVKPVGVTSLNGLGIASARVAFDDASCAYLELVGPDPKQSPTSLSEKLVNLPEGELVPMQYSLRRTDCSDLQDGWKKHDYAVDKVTMVGQDRGMPWMWDLYMLQSQTSSAPTAFQREYPLFPIWKTNGRFWRQL